MRASRTVAFTLIEVLVVIGILTILIALLLPALEKGRHQGYIAKCASNLAQIGQALHAYADAEHGQFPRTIYRPDAALTWGTQPSAPDPFTAGGPAANDVTAAAFLLLRTESVPAAIFICPHNDETSFELDKLAAGPSLRSRSNFTDY
ncbi:MAG: hypothetical protein QM770_20645 [Tepidisphaeraceae bacterium]